MITRGWKNKVKQIRVVDCRQRVCTGKGLKWTLADRIKKERKKCQLRIIAPHIHKSNGNYMVQDTKACHLHEQRKSKKQLDGHKSLIFGFFSYCHLKQIILLYRSKSLLKETMKSLKSVYNWLLIHHIPFLTNQHSAHPYPFGPEDNHVSLYFSSYLWFF